MRFGVNDAESNARCDGGSDWLCITGFIDPIADPVKRMSVGITVGRTSYFIFLLYKSITYFIYWRGRTYHITNRLRIADPVNRADGVQNWIRTVETAIRWGR
jgi:hypothetical protein